MSSPAEAVSNELETTLPSAERDEFEDAQMRKRMQNRLAQRKYRRNQKKRIQELTAAAAQTVAPTTFSSATDGNFSGNISPMSESDHFMFPMLLDPIEIPPVPNQQPMNSQILEGRSPGMRVIDPSLVAGEMSLNPTGESRAGGPSPGLPRKQSLLHRAVRGGSISVCRILLENGGNPERLDLFGKTALHTAVEEGKVNIIQLLLRNADPNARDSEGRTALFAAVENRNEETIRVLLDSGIDINAEDSHGDTALHIAVDAGSDTIVKLLLANGANPNL